MLFNMIRCSSGGLLALGNELQGSSGLEDVHNPETIDAICEMILRVFLPGEMPAAGAANTTITKNTA